MASASDYLGNIGSGALTGLAIGTGIGGPLGAPLGAAIGGIGGLFSSLFGPSKKTPEFQDPYKAQRDYAINQLRTSNLGAKAAAQAAGTSQAFARDQMEEVRNNPNFASNAGALASIQSKITGQQERGTASAYLQGAQIDQSAHERAAGLAAQGSALSQGQFELNQAYKDRPTFGEQMFQNLLSTGAGYGLRSAFGNSQNTTDNPLTLGTNSIASTQPASLTGGQSLQSLLASQATPSSTLGATGLPGQDMSGVQGTPWVRDWGVGSDILPEWNPEMPSKDIDILRSEGGRYGRPF